MQDVGGAVLVGEGQHQLPCEPEGSEEGRSFGIKPCDRMSRG